MDIRSVPDGFHARYAAHAKTYRYYILNARVDDPFTYDTCHRVGAALDLAAMQAAAAQFIGTHDFSALCASGSSAAAHGDTVRTITDCTVVQNGDLFTISVTADGYLYNMVRILAGTLADAYDGTDAVMLSGETAAENFYEKHPFFESSFSLSIHPRTLYRVV